MSVVLYCIVLPRYYAFIMSEISWHYYYASKNTDSQNLTPRCILPAGANVYCLVSMQTTFQEGTYRPLRLIFYHNLQFVVVFILKKISQLMQWLTSCNHWSVVIRNASGSPAEMFLSCSLHRNDRRWTANEQKTCQAYVYQSYQTYWQTI